MTSSRWAAHNGLTAAAYMAKAGKKVLVLERKPHVGGGVSTRELTLPGYWHDEHSNVHIMIQGNPLLRDDELGLLSKFGLEYIYPELPWATIFEDGRVIRAWKDLDRTCQGIAEFSPKDAEAYRKFVQASQQALPMFMAGLYQPPFPDGRIHGDDGPDRRGPLPARRHAPLGARRRRPVFRERAAQAAHRPAGYREPPDARRAGHRHGGVPDARHHSHLWRVDAQGRLGRAQQGAGTLHRALRRRSALLVRRWKR